MSASGMRLRSQYTPKWAPSPIVVRPIESAWLSDSGITGWAASSRHPRIQAASGGPGMLEIVRL